MDHTEAVVTIVDLPSDLLHTSLDCSKSIFATLSTHSHLHHHAHFLTMADLRVQMNATAEENWDHGSLFKTKEAILACSGSC